MKKNALILLLIVISFSLFFLIKNYKDDSDRSSWSIIVTVELKDIPKLKKALESEPELKNSIMIFDVSPLVTMQDTPKNWAFIRKHATVKAVHENKLDAPLNAR